ncbi:hypothetical protein COOONC_13954 [Cooperia oncophora]
MWRVAGLNAVSLQRVRDSSLDPFRSVATGAFTRDSRTLSSGRLPRQKLLCNNTNDLNSLSRKSLLTTPKRSLAGRSPQSVSPPHSYNSTTLSSPRTGSRNVSNFATGISSSFDDTDGSLRSPSGKRHSTIVGPTDMNVRAHSEELALSINQIQSRRGI